MGEKINLKEEDGYFYGCQIRRCIKDLQNAKKRLNTVNANILGAILNRDRVQKDDYHYSYYGSK